MVIHQVNRLYGRTLTVLVTALLLPPFSFAGPQFSRQYNTSCGTCHRVYPQLNDLGKAFRDAGFHFPQNDVAFLEIPRTYLLPLHSAANGKGQSPPLAGTMLPSHVPESEEKKYLQKLEVLSAQLNSHPFRYRFCLTTDLAARAEAPCTSQHSVRIAHLGTNTVLEITGNYYAAYSHVRVNKPERARQTFEEVILPALNMAVTQFKNDPQIQGYAIEVSYYVLARVLGVPLEVPENFAVVLPRNAAEKLVETSDPQERQVALQQGQVFLNAEPLILRLKRNSLPP